MVFLSFSLSFRYLDDKHSPVSELLEGNSQMNPT